MRFILLVTGCLMLLLSSCTQGLPENIVKAQEAYDKDPTPRNETALISAYFDAAKEEGPQQRTVLEKGLALSDQLNRPDFKASCLHALIRDLPPGQEEANFLTQLIDVMESDLKQAGAASALKRGFYEAYPDHDVSAKYKAALPGYTQNIDTMIYRAAQRINANPEKSFDPLLAREYVNISEGVVLAHEKLDSAATYLFNAAKIAGTIQDYSKSMNLYDWVISSYPDEHKRRSQSIFMKAFTYDSNLKDNENARTYYEQYLSEYPNGDMAETAKFMIENLGLSDKELLEKITKNKPNQESK